MDDMVRYTDSELVALVMQEVQASNTDWSSSIQAGRENAYRYYYGELPVVVQKNTSDHVSRDVFDAVESMKSKLLRVFASSRLPVRFAPMNEDDVEAAKARTEYVQAVLRDNGGAYRLLQTAFHDALIGKLCCFRRQWKTERVRVPQTFSAPEQDVIAAQAQGLEIDAIESVDESAMPVPTQAGIVQVPVRIVSGTAIKTEDRSRVVVEVIAPEDVVISGTATNLETARFIAVRSEKTRAELVADGFAPDAVARLSSTDGIGQSQGNIGRDDWRETQIGTEERELLTVWEAYLYLDADTPPDQDAQDAQLWSVIICGDTVLAKERIREMPLRFWCPFPVSHKAIGQSVADVTADLQRTNSNVVRGILDNVYRVNTGLRTANMAVIRNPRDLIDNPIGGVIDTPDPTAINVVPQPAISPATGLLLELMASEKEMRTGDTRLAKGMQNEAVISHQNAEGMIDRLMTASNERLMEMARSFAEMCWRYLMSDIYRIGYENNHTIMIRSGNGYVQFSPQMAGYADVCDVSVALTPEEGTKHAQRLLALHQVLSADPAVQPLYGAKERYALLAQVCELLGEPNWLADPASPDGQARMAQAAEQQAMIQQMTLQQAQAKALREQVEARAKMDSLQLSAMQGADKQALDEEKFRWQQKVDVTEAQLEARQRRPVALK